MNLDYLTDRLKDMLDNLLHSDWMGTALTVVICIGITALLSHLLTKVLRQWLARGNSPLPSSSIFINIARVVVWVIGASVILSTCFKVNVSGAVTALGIGGIAISLGFQATLSNLIGGLQLSLTGLVKPGDHIKVQSHAGIVSDVTWRHTAIITTRGEHVIIPNSVINSEALIRLLPQNAVRIGILVDPDSGSLKELAKHIEDAVDEAVSSMTVMEQKAKVQFAEVTDRGYKGELSFAVAEGANVGDVKDAALKAISEYAVRSTLPKFPASKLVMIKNKERRKAENGLLHEKVHMKESSGKGSGASRKGSAAGASKNAAKKSSGAVKNKGAESGSDSSVGKGSSVAGNKKSGGGKSASPSASKSNAQAVGSKSSAATGGNADSAENAAQPASDAQEASK